MMRRREDGATLIELLAAVVILGIISAALTESIILGLRTTEATERTVSGSLDRQLASAYFYGDVQSSDDVSTNPGGACPGATPVDVKVTLRWTDAGVNKAASYAVDPGQRRLLRRYCENGTLSVQNTVAGSLAAADPPVTVTCVPAGTPADPCGKVNISVKDENGVAYELEAARRVVTG